MGGDSSTSFLALSDLDAMDAPPASSGQRHSWGLFLRHHIYMWLWQQRCELIWKFFESFYSILAPLLHMSCVCLYAIHFLKIGWTSRFCKWFWQPSYPTMCFELTEQYTMVQHVIISKKKILFLSNYGFIILIFSGIFRPFKRSKLKLP